MFAKSIVLFVGLLAAISGEKMKYVFDNHTQGWLKLHDTPATMNDAMILCDIEGGFLADLRDTDMRSGIENYLSQVDKSINEIITFPTVELDTNGFSSSSDHQAWNIKEGTLKNVTHSHKLPYICYKDKLVSNPCGEFVIGYTYEPKSSGCYKFHSDVQSWNDAYTTCRAEGGYLAIANSETEFEVLRDILVRHPEDTLVTEPRNVFIGFRDWLDGDSWKTVEGQSLEQAGYSKWSSQQPNGQSMDPQQYCGAITRFEYFNDMPCDKPIHYICEKTPNSY